jgi:hypothetical protein
VSDLFDVPAAHLMPLRPCPRYVPSGIANLPKIVDRILSSQAMTPTSGDARNSDSRPIGNFGNLRFY